MCFIFHKWSKWGDKKFGSVIDVYDKTKTPLGSYITQERRCSTCNKVQLRTEKTA